ncbi:MAG: acyl carrier protein [Alicyclobacillus sp.]|nr:acyl carrier protein [Alicyclobacillus sp.]
MDRKTIEARVRQILGDYLQVNPDEIQPTQHVVNDLGADSLDLTELVTALEDNFDIEISDADFSQLTTVGGIESYLEQRLAGGAA